MAAEGVTRKPRRSPALWLLLAASLASAEDRAPALYWGFDADAQTGDRNAAVSGHRRYVDGVAGQALVFDGYTTAVSQDPATVPDLRRGFTVTGWIAVAAYPWAPVPIIDQRGADGRGFSVELGARGELSLSVAVDGRTISAVSDDYVMPHREWRHVAAAFDPASGLAVYLDGRRIAGADLPPATDFAGRNPTGRFDQAADLDIILGATRAPVRPVGYHRHAGTRPTWLSLDALLDETSLYDAAVSPATIAALARRHRPGPPPLPPRIMPSGPAGPGRFGAYETTLSYYPEWDALSRVGKHADIVVRFDLSPARVVFWRGTQYSPAWVTGNGLWMADQSVEGYDDDYTWEHMNDKHNRYSHVRVIEDSDARVVVHWRYAPVNVNDELMNVGGRDETGAWVDEYYTYYPDVTGVRKVSWQTGTLGEPIQYQESIPLAHPGQLQGDVVHPSYATVGNLAGETGTLAYVDDPGSSARTFPPELTIQMHHFRAEERPFIVFEPGSRMGYLRDLDQRSLARPGSSSHWPVARIWSDGRTAQAPDRATSFLGFPITEPVIHRDADGRSHTASLYGMTRQPFDDVVVLARSWSRPPPARLLAGGFDGGVFERSERVYRFRREDGRELVLGFDASDASPLYNLPILVENWGAAGASLEIDGREIPRGDDFRYGHVHTLADTHLVTWIAVRTTEPTRIRLSRTGDED